MGCGGAMKQGRLIAYRGDRVGGPLYSEASGGRGTPQCSGSGER